MAAEPLAPAPTSARLDVTDHAVWRLCLRGVLPPGARSRGHARAWCRAALAVGRVAYVEPGDVAHVVATVAGRTWRLIVGPAPGGGRAVVTVVPYARRGGEE